MCRIISVQGFYFADNISKLFSYILVLPLNPFIATEQRYFLGNLWWRELNLVVTKRLDNRTGFCRLCGQPFQFLLLYVEFVGLVFKFGLILCNELLYICLLYTSRCV